ncbi:MAG TPA: YhdH/YhfP family quinone oxidoreductase [Ignavibacteriaceae bacterium]|nr:YhdH/YhfP family quinone oxidoreductase [Ignavibacteriaceae bacterium]
MDGSKYSALVVREDNGRFIRDIEARSLDDLPEGDILINVKYSSLNYKDALSATGNKGVTRKYPHTPGIDAAGIVVESTTKDFSQGDEVLVTGFDLGMNTAGGYGQFIRVPSQWVVRLPQNMTLRESMIYGTAGFTAALSLYNLESEGLNNEVKEDILVTGATGGVGSLSIAILSKAGYKNITAATGKVDKEPYLKSIGVSTILSREICDDNTGRELLPIRWAAVIDSVGGNILATAIKSTVHGGSIAACGLTQSPKLNTSVYPFILRGVKLLGSDSAHCKSDIRNMLWKKLSGEWKPRILDSIASECSLEELSANIDQILGGNITGRVVIRL